jgi:hypothetical protein
MPPSTDLLQGTLDLLILKTLALGPMHGWGISLRIQQVSKEVLQVARDRSTLLCIVSNTRAGSGRNGATQKTTAGPSSTR